MDFLNSLLDNIEEALIVTNRQGDILFFNKVAELISQVSEAPIGTGKNIIDIENHARRKVVDEILQELRQHKEILKSFAEYKDGYDNILYLEFKYVPFVNDDDELTHIFVIFKDITPQKVYERKIVNQASNISSLMDKANAIIIGLDARGYITDWNQHCASITGFRKDDVLTQKFSEVLLADQDKMEFNELMVNVFSQEVFTNYEITIYTKEKEQRQFLLNSSIRTSETGNVIGVVFVGQDATELLTYRKSLERQVENRTFQLQQALAKEKEIVDMKSRFVSVASHEFRTPLSSIAHAATFIKDHQRIKPKELAHKLETIEKQIKHMTHLLDDVLTYGRSEAGKIKLIESDIKMDDFIEKIVEEVGHGTKNTHRIDLIRIQLPPLVFTDEKLLRSIVINLLTNAIKFSPGGKQVYFEMRGYPDKLAIEIRDEGIGIPDDELSKIFEPFERGKNVTSIQGTGLGLSIAKKAVELLAGSIQVMSKVNEGTTFLVTIPLKKNESR